MEQIQHFVSGKGEDPALMEITKSALQKKLNEEKKLREEMEKRGKELSQEIEQYQQLVSNLLKGEE